MLNTQDENQLSYPAPSDKYALTSDLKTMQEGTSAAISRARAQATTDALNSPALAPAAGMKATDGPAAIGMYGPEGLAIDLVMPDGSLAPAPVEGLRREGMPTIRATDSLAAVAVEDSNGRSINLIMADGSPGPAIMDGIKAELAADAAKNGRVVHPAQDLFQMGTSLTRLGGADAQVRHTVGFAAAREIGKSDYNLGWNGRDSHRIAGKAGALPLLTTAPVTIPADTATAVTVPLSWELEDAGTKSMPWTLGGIPGQMTRTGTTTGSFKRDTAGEAVTLPAGTQAVFQGFAAEARDRVVILECSRNNDAGEDPGVVITHQKAIIRFLTASAVVPRFLIMGEVMGMPTRDGGIDTGETDEVKAQRRARNAAIKAAWPDAYVPAFEWLLTDEAADYLLALKASPPAWLEQVEKDALATFNGFTAQDRVDIAAGITPQSLRLDWLHPNRLGNLCIGHRLVVAMRERGWVL